MINLKIDPEFQSQIPPLTDDEFKQLEENILKEGKLLSPLIVWNNTLVDGHNRYAILQKHPEIYFLHHAAPHLKTAKKPLRGSARISWGGATLAPEQKTLPAWEAVRMPKRKLQKIFRRQSVHFSKEKWWCLTMIHHHSGKKTCDRIAEENGVSRASVLRAGHYTRGH